MSTQKKDNY